MNKISRIFIFVSAFILMSATGARAQRFPEVSFKTIEEHERATKTGSVPINTVDAYRKALSEQTNTLGQWRIIKDWIDDNRYVQLLGPWMKERLLFKRSSTTFTHEYGDAEYDDTNGYALPHGVYLKLQVTKDKLTYFIRNNTSSVCGFRYSDEWVDGNRGYIPAQPHDYHNDFGCHGGTHKAVVDIYGADGKTKLRMPYTYTCTHNIRQIPRTAGARRGGVVRAYGPYERMQLKPGQVYIAPAGEHDGDPFADWLHTYESSVTVSLAEMAKLNNMTKQELALQIVLMSQTMEYGFFFPTHDVPASKFDNIAHVDLRDGCLQEVDSNDKIVKATKGYSLRGPYLATHFHYDRPTHLLSYGFWDIFDLDTYTKNCARDEAQKALACVEAGDYLCADEHFSNSLAYYDDEAVKSQYEEAMYTYLMSKIEDETATLGEIVQFLNLFKNRKPIYERGRGGNRPFRIYDSSQRWYAIYDVYLNYKAIETARQFDFRYTTDAVIDSMRALNIGAKAKQVIEEEVVRMNADRDAYAIKELSSYTIFTSLDSINRILDMPLGPEARIQADAIVKRLDEEREEHIRITTQTPFVKWGPDLSLAIGRQRDFGLGMGINWGRNHHRFNVYTGINYEWVKTSFFNAYTDPPEGDLCWGIKYRQLTTTCEVHYNLVRAYTISVYTGAGLLYHANMGCKLYPLASKESPMAMPYGVKPVSMEGRLLFGMNTERFDFNFFVDFDLVPALDPRAFTQLYDYYGPFESHLKRTKSLGFTYRIFL